MGFSKKKVSAGMAALVVAISVFFGQDFIQSVISAISIFGAAQ